MEALGKTWNDTHDLIRLDIMLPRLSGLGVLQEIREARIVTPVLMLTAKGDVADKVLGLNPGADDDQQLSKTVPGFGYIIAKNNH